MELWALISWTRQMKEVEMGETEQHMKMADISWKTKRVRWNHAIVWMWRLRKMIIDSWRQRHKLQMKHLLRRGKKKNFWLAFFLCNLIWEKKSRKINSTEADLYTRSAMLSIKGKSGKRWDLGHIKRQNFF